MLNDLEILKDDNGKYKIVEGNDIICPSVILEQLDKDELLFKCDGFILSISEPSKSIIVFIIDKNIETELRKTFKDSTYSVKYISDYIGRPYQFVIDMIKYGMGLY